MKNKIRLSNMITFKESKDTKNVQVNYHYTSEHSRTGFGDW